MLTLVDGGTMDERGGAPAADQPEAVSGQHVVIDIRARSSHSDVYLWEAIYSDGTSFPEVGADGTLYHIPDIDHDRLVGFRLIPTRPELPPFGVQFLLGDGRRLYFRRRRTQNLQVVSEGGQIQIRQGVLPDGPTWHLLGWERDEGERVRRAILYINEEGAAFLSEDDNVPLGQ